jgi:hypothetical protein
MLLKRRKRLILQVSTGGRMVLDKLKKLLGLTSIPEPLNELFKGARTEQEALLLMREARRRDESRRRRAMEDLEILHKHERELLAKGRAEESDAAKQNIVRQIKEVRWKTQEIDARIERIYNKRIKIYNEHIQSLETILDLGQEQVPEAGEMEDAAVRAREMLEDLDKRSELAEGIGITESERTSDPEDQAILAELEAARDAELEASEASLAEPTAPDKNESDDEREVMFE